VAGSKTAAAGHTFKQHTGEVRLELSAPSCEELFAEAGRGLAELMLGNIPASPASAKAQSIEVSARDRCALLVAWLNELVFRSETSKRVFTQFQVDYVDDSTLRASAWSMEPNVLKTAVKAATLHRVAVKRLSEGWRATVVLDV
jgi:SHS2 domain-containing protein